MKKLIALLLLLPLCAFAQQQVVGIGAAPDDGTGDPARTAFDKLNDNDTELYAKFPVNLTNNVTGTLPVGNGGLGITTTTDDTIPLGTGSAYVATAVTNCTDTGGNRLNYDATTNTFSCGSGNTSGTFVATFETACTTDPTITFDWRRQDGIVLMRTESSSFVCTSDSTAILSTSTPVPSAIRPSINTVGTLFFGALDNTAVQGGACIVLLPDGNIAISRWLNSTAPCVATGAGWTATGSKNLNVLQTTNVGFSYMLGNP